MIQFQSLKSNLAKSRIVDTLSKSCKDGEILVRIESFAFTSNNITYGVAGKTLGYWNFFPVAGDSFDQWGCIPVWGFAEVIESNCDDINNGERLFGYFPPADYLTLSPIRISNHSFADGTEHRRELPAVYNNYVRLAEEQDYDASFTDAMRALLFPLHITAFCLCDWLADESYLGASQIIVVSASSKTAIGLAQGLAESKDAPKIVGLTSRKNLEFVKNLGCYDEVVTYDELQKVDCSQGSVMVDMAGSREILGTLHRELGDNMLKCLTVGMTHWYNATAAEDALGQAMLREKTEFFFAPAHIQKRIGEWGHDAYAKKTNTFMAKRAIQSKDWMQIIEINGLDQFIPIYEEMVGGNINPNEGIIVNLNNG